MPPPEVGATALKGDLVATTAIKKDKLNLIPMSVSVTVDKLATDKVMVDGLKFHVHTSQVAGCERCCGITLVDAVTWKDQQLVATIKPCAKLNPPGEGAFPFWFPRVSAHDYNAEYVNDSVRVCGLTLTIPKIKNVRDIEDGAVIIVKKPLNAIISKKAAAGGDEGAGAAGKAAPRAAGGDDGADAAGTPAPKAKKRVAPAAAPAGKAKAAKKGPGNSR